MLFQGLGSFISVAFLDTASVASVCILSAACLGKNLEPLASLASWGLHCSFGFTSHPPSSQESPAGTLMLRENTAWPPNPFSEVLIKPPLSHNSGLLLAL